MPRRMQQTGFTLLEVMIAFSLLSLLFVGLFSSFYTISRGWDAADNRMLKTEDMRLISDFLRRQLSQMVVVRVMGKDQTGNIAPVYAFNGEREAVRYASPLQPLQGQGGLYLIELAVKTGRNGKKLEMRYTPYRPETDWGEAFDDSEPVLVFDGLKSVQFSYYAAENVNEEPDWENEWEDKLVYPLSLKLVIADQERQWPDLLVSLPQVDEYVMSSRFR